MANKVLTLQELETLIYVKIANQRNLIAVGTKDISGVLKKILEFIDIKLMDGVGIDDTMSTTYTTYSSTYIRQILNEAINQYRVFKLSTTGIMGNGSNPVTINWQTDIIPNDDITYFQKHGPLEACTIQLLVPAALNNPDGTKYMPSSNWTIDLTNSPTLYLDNQMERAVYTIYGGDVYTGTPTDTPTNPMLNWSDSGVWNDILNWLG